MWRASWSTTVLKNSILQSPLALICRKNLWIKIVSGIDGAWWLLSDSTISSDLSKYILIIDDTNLIAASENFLGIWTTIWSDFTFRKMTFWWFRLRHPLGLYHGVLYCRLSVHTITPQNDIGEWFTTFRLHSINHLFQKTHVILLWCEFSVTTTALLFLISLVTTLNWQLDVKSEKLWSPK